MEIGQPSEVIKRNNSENENKSSAKTLGDSIYPIFKSLHSKFFLNEALFYGRDAVKNLFQSKSKVIGAPCASILNELTSFVQNNARIPNLFSYNKTIDQRYIDIFNEILVNSYSASEINKHLINAWKDFMVNGLGIIKLTGDFDNCLDAEVITPNSVIFDYSNIDKPQFFIQEKFMSVASACSEYDIDQKEFGYILGKTSQPKIIYSMSSWNNAMDTMFSFSEEGKSISSKTMQDVFSKDFINKIIYEKPKIGLNVVREEYRLANTKKGDEIIEMYERNIFLNDILVSTNSIHAKNFPFVLLHNYKPNILHLEEAFPCFVDQVKGDILLYNNLNCLQIDGLTTSAAGSSLVIMKEDNLENGANINNQPPASLNVMRVKGSVDSDVNSVIIKTPPIDLSQSIQNEMQLCLSRIKSNTGLMDFETPLKSGRQESLRLDREMSTISYWLTSLDSAIINIGKLIKNIITKMLGIDVKALKMFLSDPEILNAENCKTLIRVSKESINGIVENKDSFTYKNKVINDLIEFRDLTGQPLQGDAKKLAESMNMPQEVIDIIGNNAPDPKIVDIELKDKLSEIEKKRASAVKDIAMAEKYSSEAKTEQKNLKERPKSDTDKPKTDSNKK